MKRRTFGKSTAASGADSATNRGGAEQADSMTPPISKTPGALPSPEKIDATLDQYATLAVKVGLNLQPGQRLMIAAPIETRPLVTRIAAAAYDAGARYVDVLWPDEQLDLMRYQHAPRDSFGEFPDWALQRLMEYTRRGDASLHVTGENPDLFAHVDPQLIGKSREAAQKGTAPYLDCLQRMEMNWCVIAAATAGWAAMVFPQLPAEAQIAALWQSIFTVCRLDAPDPIAAWQACRDELANRCAYLNARRYRTLALRAPGTDLKVGLPEGHRWEGGAKANQRGIVFIPNLPTEEVGTMPHRARVDGRVTSTRPLSLSGVVIPRFSLTFEAGRVSAVQASGLESHLEKLLQIDEGSSRLGEIALVPASSPVSRLGTVFYNILLDENAACHLAFGSAYPVCCEGGQAMSDKEFIAAGGNKSSIHVDFMIGSEEMDIDGVRDDGLAEPIIRSGEYAFSV